MSKKVLWFVAAALVAIAVACGDKSPNPATPSSNDTSIDDSNAAADGATLKASAPVPFAPANGEQLTARDVTLKTLNPVGEFVPLPAGVALYFELQNDAGVTLVSSGPVPMAAGDTTAFAVPLKLDVNKLYRWRVRAGLDGAFTAWSAFFEFLSPKKPDSFLNTSGPNRVFDELTDSKTVANGAVNDVTFIPGKGVQLNGQNSFVEYKLGGPLSAGEFSFFAENIGNGSEEWKTKILSMLTCGPTLGCVNVTDNQFRTTLDKRSNWLNQGSLIRFTVRWGAVTDSIEAKGRTQNWSRSKTYFWQWTWGNGVARVLVLDGTRVVEDLSHSIGPYRPPDHVARLGSVGGRGGDDTLPGVIIRKVWISANPRPAEIDLP